MRGPVGQAREGGVGLGGGDTISEWRDGGFAGQAAVFGEEDGGQAADLGRTVRDSAEEVPGGRGGKAAADEPGKQESRGNGTAGKEASLHPERKRSGCQLAEAKK